MKALLVTAATVLAFCCTTLAHAEDYNNIGKTFGKGQLDKLKGSVSDQNAKNAPFYNDNPPQKSTYSAASLFDVGSGRISSCKTATATGDKIADQECEAVNFLAKNPENRVRFELSPTDPAIIAGRAQANNGANMLDVITGGQECVDKTTTTPAEYSTKSCVEYLPVEDKTCVIGQQVDVDADSNFQCDITYQALERYTCQKRLTVTCEKPTGCNLGGLIGNPSGDMQVVTSTAADGTYDIQFGSIGDNYWSGNKTYGTAYDRQLTFDLADVSLVDRFLLKRVEYDDWLWIKINDVTIYVGPKGGDRLELNVVRWLGQYPAGPNTYCQAYDSWFCVVQTGTDGRGRPILTQYSHEYCELQSDNVWRCDYRQELQYGPDLYWSYADLKAHPIVNMNIDLRPYLKTGRNVLWTRTVVAGGGEMWLTLNTQVQCPTNCKDIWEDQCTGFEARTK